MNYYYKNFNVRSVGVFRKGKIEIIPNEFGRNITPSYVAFTDYGEILIGDEAKNYLTTDPTNTVYDSKRLIGNLFNSSTLQNDMKYWPFKIINKDNKPFIQIRNKHFHKDFSPVEISALILKKMKEIAEEYLNEKITYAVITVSAYFNDAQRQATMDAASIAGLTVLRLLNEPVAASLAYGLDKKQADKKDDNGRNILVYDLGGGTFDASILNINEGVFEVISTKGDTHLGGQDFDNQIIEYLINQYEMKNGIQIGNNTKLIQKLRREVEKAKRILSTKSSTTIDIESFFDDKPFQIDLSRRQFERINKDLFERTLMHIENVIKDAGLNNSKIDEVVLIGGSTLIPNIQKIISEFFNNKKLYTEINPHEAVAHGAAIQASIMSGSNNYPNNPVLVDTNPMNLGIEIKDGNMSELISRNNPKPFKRSQLFTTTEDYQKSVLIQIYEGDYPKAKQNNLLGVFELKDIGLEPKGQPLIEVTFEIDANGILIVTAQDIYNMTNKNKIEINNTLSRISELDIKKMTDEHEHLMQRNKRIQRKLNAKNQLEAYAFKMKHKNNYNERSLRKIEETITWLELNGINADTNEYSLRLNELKQLEKDEF